MAEIERANGTGNLAIFAFLTKYRRGELRCDDCRRTIREFFNTRRTSTGARCAECAMQRRAAATARLADARRQLDAARRRRV